MSHQRHTNFQDTVHSLYHQSLQQLSTLMRQVGVARNVPMDVVLCFSLCDCIVHLHIHQTAQYSLLQQCCNTRCSGVTPESKPQL